MPGAPKRQPCAAGDMLICGHCDEIMVPPGALGFEVGLKALVCGHPDRATLTPTGDACEGFVNEPVRRRRP